MIIGSDPFPQERLVTKPDAEALSRLMPRGFWCAKGWMRISGICDAAKPPVVGKKIHTMNAGGQYASWSKTTFRVFLILLLYALHQVVFFPASSNLNVLSLIYSLSNLSAWTKTSNLRWPPVFILKANTVAAVFVLVKRPARLPYTPNTALV